MKRLTNTDYIYQSFMVDKNGDHIELSDEVMVDKYEAINLVNEYDYYKTEAYVRRLDLDTLEWEVIYNSLPTKKFRVNRGGNKPESIKFLGMDVSINQVIVDYDETSFVKESYYSNSHSGKELSDRCLNYVSKFNLLDKVGKKDKLDRNYYVQEVNNKFIVKNITTDSVTLVFEILDGGRSQGYRSKVTGEYSQYGFTRIVRKEVTVKINKKFNSSLFR